MWDPRQYRDSDFGLESDESFEPEDADQAAEIDLTRPHIMTVLGPIEPDQLGTCQPLEHILADPTALATSDRGFRLDRLDLAAEELEMYVTSGGRAMVDASTRDYGRNLPGLRALAQRVPVHLIAVTGRATDPHAALIDGALEPRTLENEFLAEIAGGVGRAHIQPGAVTCAASPDGVTPAEGAAIVASARVAAATGLPLIARAGSRRSAEAMLDRIEGNGLSSHRTILALDGDVAGGASLAARGCWLLISGVGRDIGGQDEALANAIVALADAGHAARLLISQGIAHESELTSWGGAPGWTHLLGRFLLRLMDAGAPAQLVRSLLVEHPAVALSIVPVVRAA